MSDLPMADRMKRYEAVSHMHLTPRSCCIIRADGRAFHSFTAKMAKPFSTELMASLQQAARLVAQEMDGFKVGYLQSDEMSFLLTDFDTIQTEPWFGYDVQKLVSIVASHIAASVALDYRKHCCFDARAFVVPRDEVANYFLWRARDWSRNSLQMYARHFFSQKELHGKNRDDMHEMLHGIGKNWTTDLSPQERNGLFLVKVGRDIEGRPDIPPTYATVAALVEGALVSGEPSVSESDQ